jgi:hypothetical protein
MTEPAVRNLASVGILAYGSLISDPGVEISPMIVKRIPTRTPFSVEYARFSTTRGGAPTAVPHPSGSPVKAVVLVLADGVPIAEARDLLWRRETRIEGSGRTYRESRSSNAVIVRDLPGFCGLESVIYTDLSPDGKVEIPDPESLAEAAIASVGRANAGKDGISYLIDLLEAGVETPLTRRYIAEILARTSASDLADALRKSMDSQ